MTLNLHQGLKDRIKSQLVAQVPTIEVNNKKFLKRDSTGGFIIVNDALPEHGPIVDVLKSIIGEWPLYDFLYGFLSKELNDQQTFDSDAPLLKLNEIDEYSDVEAFSQRLLEEFNSLPWKYRFTIDFKSSLVPLFSDIPVFNITDTMRLVKPNEVFVAEHPFETADGRTSGGLLGLAMLGSYMPREWKDDSLYLQIDTDGFIGKYVSTQTTESVVSKIKSFCGLSIALRLLKVEHTYHPATPKMHLVAHKWNSKKWFFEESEEINDDISRAMSDLVLNDLDGRLDTDAKKSTWVRGRLEDISTVFDNPDKSEKILLAAQWFFESYSGRNELLSFVQTMVTLEIMLGDKASSEAVGLGELLRNRCAYLIGKTHDQRKEILDDFKKIYDIRSKIVHRGKSKLTRQERSLFGTLQWICRRVIQEEVILLKANT